MSIFENIGNRDMLVSDLIPIERYDENMQAFLMRNQTVKYMDIIQIKATDLMNKSEYEIDYINMQWAKFLKPAHPTLNLLLLIFRQIHLNSSNICKEKSNNAKILFLKIFLK